MQDKLKENISKSEHLAELFAEREGVAIFLKWARIPSRYFFLKWVRIPRRWERFPRNLFMLSCTIQYIPYDTTMAQILKKNIGTIFEKKNKIWARNSYNPYNLYMSYFQLGAKIEVGTKIEESSTII